MRNRLIPEQWARTPPSASWRFDTGSERNRDSRDGGRDSGRGGGRDGGRSDRRERSPRRGRSGSPPRRSRYEDEGTREGTRDRDYDRRDRDRDTRRDRERTRTPEDRDRDRDMKDRDREEERERGEPEREREYERENGTNGEERKGEHAYPPVRCTTFGADFV